MNELEKLNLKYTAKRMGILKDKKYMELQKEIEQAQVNMIQYLKNNVIEELKK